MTLSITEYLISISFAPAVGIIFMLIFLFMNSKSDLNVKRLFGILLVLELIEMIAYDWELVTAGWDHVTFLRILLSFIGYSIRPLMAYMILLLTLRVPFLSKKAHLYLIPVIINMLVHATGFFGGIAFSYTEDNNFTRGPLGLTSQCVLFLYFFWILIVTIKYRNARSKLETFIVFASVMLCANAIIIESAFGLRSFGRTSIIMATIFYFMYFQSNNYEQKIEETRTVNRALKKASQTDALTHLLNKNAFLELVEQSLHSTASATNVLFFLDLDNFKQYNDTHGHLAGDELLKEVSHRLRAVFRDSDLIGRFGGDEFYMYMKGVPYDTVLARATQLIRELNFESEDGKTCVSASLGIIYQEHDSDISCSELIRLADIALYDAKKLGKNRFVINTQ